MYNLPLLSSLSFVSSLSLLPVSNTYLNTYLNNYFDMDLIHILNIHALLICYISFFYSLYILNINEKRRAQYKIKYNNQTNKIQNQRRWANTIREQIQLYRPKYLNPTQKLD